MPDVTAIALASVVAALYGAKKLFRRKGRVEQVHLRGRSIKTSKEAAEILLKARHPNDPGLRLGQQLFPSEVATRHTLFLGATGSGKTILQRFFIQTALSKIGIGHSQRAVVYDAKQDMVSILSGMRLSCPIVLLNPLDARSVAWAMASDIRSPSAALQVASILIPESKGDSNPFFSHAARHLLYGAILALMQLSDRWSFRHVLLLLRDPERLKSLLSRSENTKHLLVYFGHEGTCQNILSTIMTHIGPYEIIAACFDQAENEISLSDWTASGASVLVLGNDEENTAAISTVNRLLFRRLAELTLSGPEVDDRAPDQRRTFFFLDEVREAGKLDLLGRLLTKGRSKGAAVSLGVQDICGMWEVYGKELANELLGQCNTKVVLRLNSPESANFTSKLCGNREIIESRHSESRNRRVSLNGEASLGDSTSHAITQQPLILESEIMGLPETNRENGLTALFINPTTGPFIDHIEGDWISRHLAAADPGVQNFVPRPVSHQYLRPWSEEDDAILLPGTCNNEEPDNVGNVEAESNSWCH